MGLVVIGASPNIARVAQQLCPEVLFLQRPGSLDPRLLREDVDELFTLEYADPAVLVPFGRQVLAPRRPAAVVSVTEDGLEPAAVLSDLLGTPGPAPDVVRTTRDKRAMRRVLDARAPHLTVPWADPGDAAAVDRLFATAPAVVAKPATGTASAGVRLLRSAAEAGLLPPGVPYLLEAYAPGAEFSVEAFSRDGRHTVLAVAEKGVAGGFVEVSHLVPPAVLDAAGTALVERAVRDLLDALSVRDGPTHTELKVHGGTATVIETHTRPGGDGIADLVATTTGVDWRRVSVGWPLGAVPEPAPPAAAAAAAVFFTAPPGMVTAVAGPPPDTADVRVESWEVGVAVGDRVGELRSSRDRLGSAGVAGTSAAACRRFLDGLGAGPVRTDAAVDPGTARTEAAVPAVDPGTARTDAAVPAGDPGTARTDAAPAGEPGSGAVPAGDLVR